MYCTPWSWCAIRLARSLPSRCRVQIACSTVSTTSWLVIVVATDSKDDVLMLFVYAAWAVGGVGVLLLVAAGVSKIIQIGVRSAGDD